MKKISEIFVRDGGKYFWNAGSGEKKLQAIEALVLEEANITRTPLAI